MTPDEAKQKLAADVLKDITKAEDAIEAFVHDTGLPPRDALNVFEAAIAHMRATFDRINPRG